MIEDDLIFPCGAQKEWQPPEVSLLERLPLLESVSTGPSPGGSQARVSTLSTKASSARLSSFRFVNEPRKSDSDTSSVSVHIPPKVDYGEILEPTDHSKLKAAWDSMLQHRFLPSGLLSVLQFYFTAEFQEVQTHPTVQIPLPRNTRLNAKDSRQRSDTNASCPILDEGDISAILAIGDIPLPEPIIEQHQAHCDLNTAGKIISSTWSDMHLAKACSIVNGCKDLIWEEYKSLETNPTTDSDTREYYEEFLAAWTNWEW